MLILPVLDIMRGEVVRAVGGRRSEYRPLVSQLTTSIKPLDVMKAIQERFGWTQFYVADLDAITGDRRVFRLNHLPTSSQFWLDAGVRTVADVVEIHRPPVSQVVVGSETLASLEEGRAIIETLGPEKVTFSLDLRNGQLIGAGAGNWDDPASAAVELIAIGARRLIVLDLARVGESDGPARDDLCRKLIRRHPYVHVFTGGGIRGVDDLRRLSDIGVSGALIASALHDGRITPEDLASVEA
jgi:phosphoribosylformimino-5-aminoimidazole carboxamide ribotide isomerase